MTQQKKEDLLKHIHRSQKIILSTHKQPDGDGIGSQIGMLHALRKLDKDVRILNVDRTPNKYHYLQTEELTQAFLEPHTPLEKSDLTLIFDTNDRRLLHPLYQELELNCKEIIFIDHHPLLEIGPIPTPKSLVNTKAASTGEMTYEIIKSLGIELDAQIARALYSSIVFDTQLFRYIRNSPATHLITAELLKYEKKPEEIHRYLFGHHSVEKIRFLSQALSQIQYYCNDKLAVLQIQLKELNEAHLDMDDSRDLIDLIMNIEPLEVAVLIRTDDVNEFKVSIRSKGRVPILQVAESFGGGGHLFSSGAYVQGDMLSIKKKLIDKISNLLMNNELKKETI